MSLDVHECRMAFVRVPRLRIDPERAQHAHATDAEHPLLTQSPSGCAGVVETRRQLAVGGVVHVEIGIGSRYTGRDAPDCCHAPICTSRPEIVTETRPGLPSGPLTRATG